jgi:hypothetical protein
MVATILETNGTSTPVYRAAEAKIGCSFMNRSERDLHRAWLQKESAERKPCIVVYDINTSLNQSVVQCRDPPLLVMSSNVLNNHSASVGANNPISNTLRNLTRTWR